MEDLRLIRDEPRTGRFPLEKRVLNLKDDLQFAMRNLNLISARLTRWNAERCFSLPNNASLSMKHLKLFFRQFLVSSKGRYPEKNAA